MSTADATATRPHAPIEDFPAALPAPAAPHGRAASPDALRDFTESVPFADTVPVPGAPPRDGTEGSVLSAPGATRAAALAAFLIVLHRHTGRTDPALGVATAASAGFRPLRTVIDPEESFAALVHRVGPQLLEEAHPAQPDTHPGWSPTVAFRTGPPDDAAGGPLPERGLWMTVSGAAVHLRYDADRFTRASAARLLRDHAEVLAQAAADPQIRVRRLRLRPGQRRPDAWGLPEPPGFRAAVAPRPGESLLGRFQEVARAHPAHEAVLGPSGSLTYAALAAAAKSAANRLKAGPGDRVALLCAHDVDAAIGVWAVLSTGAAYVALDARQPDGRIARLLAGTQVSALVCDGTTAGRARALAKNLPVLVLGPGDRAPRPPDQEPARQPADAAAYLLPTSGTTGAPKTVAQSAHNVLQHALTYANRVYIGPGQRIPMPARIGVDAGVMDFYAALLTGATLVMFDPLTAPRAARRALADCGARLLHCTPTYLRHLLSDLPAAQHAANGSPAAADPHDPAAPELAAVRTVVLGGEQVTGADYAAFRACFPAGARLVNGLGPSECTLALQHLCTDDDLRRVSVPVGHPVPGIEVLLLDADGSPAEVYGELAYRASRVALGYWNQPGATETAFTTGPDGVRTFRTGDMARRLPDGSLAFQGRRDRQVKIRGHRVEPAESEALLRAHPTVAQAVVVCSTADGQPRLTAYVTAATALPPEEDELLDYLRRLLPEYAVPGRVTPLDELPVGPTGKLDASRLPAPPPRAAAQAPQTPTERAVARHWCAVLGIEHADPRTGFMTAGGDSIRLLALLGRIKQETGVDVALIDFLRRPTIAATAALIDQAVPRREDAER